MFFHKFYMEWWRKKFQVLQRIMTLRMQFTPVPRTSLPQTYAVTDVAV